MNVHVLNSETIAQNLVSKQIGNYWLGHFSATGSFVVRYIGRSDTCLKRRLSQHAAKGKYEAYVFRPSEQIKESFDIECREWHLLKSIDQLDNIIHPDSPTRLPYKCNYCKSIEAAKSTQSTVGGEA